MGGNPFPRWCCVVVERSHFHGNLFAGFAAALRSHGFGGGVTRVPVQPASQHYIARQAARLARQIHEHHLRYVLGQRAVAAGHPQRRRINQINVPRDQIAERRLGMFSRVMLQQLSVVRHRLLFIRTRRKRNPTKMLGRHSILLEFLRRSE